MEPRNTREDRNQPDRHEHPLPNKISKQEKENAIHAHDEAENEDAELTARNPNDEQAEGETGRLGEDTPDII